MSNTTHHQPAAQPELAPHAMQQLTAALQADPDYAWSWHCNLAMPIMDATNVSPALANVAGARLMRHLFDIDMTKHPHYLPRFDEEVAAQPEPVNALLLAALHLAVDALRAPLDGWKGELERKALDAANPVIVAATAQAQPAAVPLFLLHTGKIDNSGEQDEWTARPTAESASKNSAGSTLDKPFGSTPSRCRHCLRLLFQQARFLARSLAGGAIPRILQRRWIATLL